MTTRFVAIWHDREAILTQAGHGDEDAAFDIAEQSESAREFQTRLQATAFLKKLIRRAGTFLGKAKSVR